MQSEALICNHMQSYAISGNQKQSVALIVRTFGGKQSKAIKGNQWQSKAISGPHRAHIRREAIKGNQMQSNAIKSNQWPSSCAHSEPSRS